MEYLRLTSEDAELFGRDGFFFKRGFFDGEEISLMHRALEEDATLTDNILSVPDDEWGATDEIVWNQPGDDLFGAISRCARMVEGMELLLGGSIYHYHAKFILKPPGRGGGNPLDAALLRAAKRRRELRRRRWWRRPWRGRIGQPGSS